MKTILVICGPTATGKTSLALSIARALGNTSVVSADSRQAYQDIDIISGKDIPNDLPSSVKVFGLDIFKPSETANLTEFVKYARQTIDNELISGKNIVIVGGTGLYLKGITHDLTDISVPSDRDLRLRLSLMDLSQLQNELRRLNPAKFNILNNSDLNNPRRLTRYIEISLGKPNPSIPKVPTAKYIWIGLKPDMDRLINKIEFRVIQRLNNGAIDEVKRLLSEYPDKTLPIYSSLGVREIISFIEGKITREELIKDWSASELQYAKRQLTWFNKQPGIIWYDESVDRNQLATDLQKYLI